MCPSHPESPSAGNLSIMFCILLHFGAIIRHWNRLAAFSEILVALNIVYLIVVSSKQNYSSHSLNFDDLGLGVTAYRLDRKKGGNYSLKRLFDYGKAGGD